ncbi:YrzI family small protein [Ectobacillus panaciterrae]|nr:YrzI family small protein [Ectobacillus panaciterrae]
MTLNLLFFTITVQKQKRTLEEASHDLRVQQMMDELKERQAYYC